MSRLAHFPDWHDTPPPPTLADALAEAIAATRRADARSSLGLDDRGADRLDLLAIDARKAWHDMLRSHGFDPADVGAVT